MEAGNINIIKYVRNFQYVPGSDCITACNPRILRYADVLLLKAEAIVRTGGNLAEAIGILNQIRERARNSTNDGKWTVNGDTPSTTPADLDITESNRNTVLEWVFNERRLELAFEEGHRWWDLRRRHLAGEIDIKQIDFGSRNANFQFEDYNIYFPLPNQEILDNPYLDQNQGY